MQVWAIIVDSFRDAIDRKIFWIMMVLSVAVAAAMACVSFDADGVDLLFGGWHIDAPEWAVGTEQARARVATIVVRYIVQLTIGWVGIILTLVATSSTFPSLMESGAVDILLSKPLSRTKLFLSKYLGAMVFILIQAALFVGLTFLVVGTRWHFWLWAYLWVIPLMVLLFSYVFCFSSLFGVLTRRAMPTLLLTLVAWVAITIPQRAHAFLVAYPEVDRSQQWRRVCAAVQFVVPKTQDITFIASKLVGAGSEMDVVAGAIPQSSDDPQAIEEAREAETRLSDAVDGFESISTSLVSEGIVVLLAVWLFKRKDF